MNPSRVAVFGLGYVGSVTAACLASIGHNVSGVDRDPYKVAELNAGRAPFFEPGLDEIVQSAVADGRLTATLSTVEALHAADIALICVGTPSERNGNLSLQQVHRVVEEIAATLPARKTPLIIAMRSTVFPGTLETLGLAGAAIVSNPEFLREGSAVKDFMEPSLIVVGGENRAAVERVAEIYNGLGIAPCLVSLRTAEMIKYACNAFHAVKISFANEIGSLCQSLGIPAQEVLATLCSDVKLNASAAYLKPGFAFGGSCLPKDLRAMNYRADQLGLDLPLLAHTLPSNEKHLHRAIQAVLDLNAPRLGVLGLAFKENTDDLRESPVVTLIEQLIGKGRDVRVWDPHIRLDSIYGTNRDFILRAIPHIGKLMVGSADDVVRWASHLVITQVPTGELEAKIVASGLPALNLARL